MDRQPFDLTEFSRRIQERITERDNSLEECYKDPDNRLDFFISYHELKSLHEWKAEHDKVCPLYDDGINPTSPVGAIGGRTSYKFTPTGLGVAVSVECACGESKNITDYECW